MHISDAVRSLDRDLREVFGPRLGSLVVHRAADGRTDTASLAVVDGLTAGDLRECADRIAAWHGAGLATPLLVAAQEFSRSLDAFPFEFGAILADYAVVSGRDPFAGLRVDPADMRRACEVQARSHLLHLREGYLESRGRSDAVADLIARSGPALATLVQSVARLRGAAADDASDAARQLEGALGLSGGGLSEVVSLSPGRPLSSDSARQIFPRYLEAIERLTDYIDRWSAT